MRGRALGPGRLTKENGRWILHWTDELRRRRRRVVGTERRTAERVRSEIIHRRDLALAGLSDEAGQEMAVSELAEMYLADLKPRVTRRHYQNVAGPLRAVTAKLNGTRVGELRQLDAVRIRSEAVASGLAHRTANLRIDRLRAALNWAVETELIPANPLQHLRRLPETAEHRRYRRRAMTEGEIARFIAASEADDAACDEFLNNRRGCTTRIPQTPLWIALLETGARWSELRQVAWGDVDLERRVIVLRAENTKSRKQRSVPLRTGLADRVAALRMSQVEVLGHLPTASDPVFISPDGCAWPWHTTNIMRILDRLLGAAGIKKVDVEGRRLDIHALRHTAGTRLARAGMPLVQAQRLLGHSDPKLTAEVYTHLEAEDLRPALDALPEIGPTEERRAREAQ